MGGIDLLAVLGIGVGVVALVVYLGLVIVAAVQILRAEIADLSKLAWIAAILTFPALAAIAWFALGHRTREFEHYVSRLSWSASRR